MADYLLLMHGGSAEDEAAWGPYLAGLRAAGALEGGSAIGGGFCATRSGDAPGITAHLNGYIRVQAASLDAARALLAGNPVFEAGGVVEVRELPVD